MGKSKGWQTRERASARGGCGCHSNAYTTRKAKDDEKDDVYRGGTYYKTGTASGASTYKSTRAKGWDSKLTFIKSCGKYTQEFKVHLKPLVQVKIRHLMRKFTNMEWLAHLIGEFNRETGVAVITDIIIPKQKVTGTSVNDVEFDERYDSIQKVGVIHSHHSMGAFFSGTDDDWINQNNDISIVVATNGIKGNVRVESPCGAFLMVEPKIIMDLDVTLDAESFDKEIDDHISTYTYSGYGYGYGYGEDELYGYGYGGGNRAAVIVNGDYVNTNYARGYPPVRTYNKESEDVAEAAAQAAIDDWQKRHDANLEADRAKVSVYGVPGTLVAEGDPEITSLNEDLPVEALDGEGGEDGPTPVDQQFRKTQRAWDLGEENVGENPSTLDN